MSDSDEARPEKGHVRCSVEDAIGWVILDNQARLNAMSFSMWQALGEAVSLLADNPAVRVIVLTGAGGKAFCAGADISEFETLRTGAEAQAAYASIAAAATAKLKNVGKPTIALIEGYCLGGGMGLALHCDLRIAGDDARLGIPAARRGLTYGYEAIKLLVALVGPSDAKNIFYTARQFDAAEALRMGLINEMVAGGRLRAHVRELAERIAGNAPLSVAASKFIVDTVVRNPEDRDLEACTNLEAICAASQDHAEATRAFMEKRKPVFVGR